MKSKRLCVICGKEFAPKESDQQCCSSECGRVKSSRSQRKYYPCHHCGELFWKPNAFRLKYCSKECQSAATALIRPRKEKPAPTIYKRSCAWCGTECETTIPNKIYCNSECTYNGNLKMKREQWADAYVPRTYTCKECGTEFTTECGNKHSVFCCQSCADKNERRQEHATERHKKYMREAKKRREKLLAANFVENVSYEAVYERDNGVCQICGLPVHPTKGIDNNWDGTIDHIEPLSVGGKHSMANCQLAHRICNSLKRQQSDTFTVDWQQKAQEDNYWRIKFEQYQHLMSA